jgi:PAS domain S-box-containing protein
LSSAIVQAYMRFRAEEALRKSEQQNKFLADIITSASQAVGVGYPDGRLGMVNKAFEELTGYTAEELKSVDWAKTLTRMKWQKIEEEKLEELSRTGKPVRYEKEYIRKDGTVVPIELLVHLVKDTNGKPQYYYSFITDITERKRADEAIRKSESRYRSYVEVSGQFAWVTNAQGEIKEDTPYLRQFSGQTYEQAKGNGWAATLHPDDLPNTLQIWQEAVRTKQPYETEYRMRRHDGQYRYMLARGTPVFNNDGSVAEWVGVCIDITERKRQEEIMRQSEERLKRAQEIAHLGSWELDLVNNRLTWSDEVYQIFGLKPQEFAATYKAFLERVHPDDRAAVDAAYSDSLRENRKAYEIEHRVVRKDTSEIRIVHEKCEHFRDKTGKIVRSVGMVHDITDRREAQEALANERANLQTIFDAVDVGMLLISEDGSVKRVNNAVTRWIRKDPSAVGREQPGDILGCIHALDDPAGCGHALKCGTCPIRKAFESSLHSGEAVHDIEAQTVLSVDGRQMSLWLDVSADPVVIDGKRHVILSLNNITASKTAEAALRESELRERHRARELERLTNELEHKNEELESIIRIASHDLRSPLMNIKGFSGELSKDIGKVHQMLNEAQLSETVRGKVETVFTKYVPEAIGFIQTSADSINQMLRSLMQVAKAGTVPINVRDLDMNSIFAAIAAHSKFKLSEINGRLEIEPLHGCRADADQMIQVFTNLVENAIKYREPTRPVQIRVYASAEPDKVTYCVEDNGKGIAAEHLDKVFNLFTRLDPEAARGEGLGLTIAKRMVERQGGMIWANSEVDKGSKFYVALPR